MLLLIVGAAFLAGSAFLIGEVATLPQRERRDLIRHATHYGAAQEQRTREWLSLRERLIVPASGRIAGFMLRLNRRESLERVHLRLMAAGMRTVSPSSFLAAKGFLGAFGAGAGFVFWAVAGAKTGIMLTLAFGGAGFTVPGYLVGVRARRRREQVQAALPDALDILAVSVEAGLGFDGAVAKLTEHMRGPLIDELGLALAEMRVGESRSDALKKLAARVDTPELSAFVRAIIQADQLGISLGNLLRVQASETRLKRQAAAEEKAMKAPIKMLFPTVAFIFPAMFIVVLGPAMISLGRLFGF